jgi:hypothetical protein
MGNRSIIISFAFNPFPSMSFNDLDDIESQRLPREPYSDDPGFSRLSSSISRSIYSITANIAALNRYLSHVGTNKDTQSLREKLHALTEETRDKCKSTGADVKKLQAWDNVEVCATASDVRADVLAVFTKIHPAKDF